MKRDSNIELFRCFCMFFVVLNHVCFYNKLCGNSWFMWHVPGFLIVSGFFGVRFSFGKIVKLLGITYACWYLTIPLRSPTTFINYLLPHGGWYLPFYLLLIVFCPVLNSALENKINHKAVTQAITLMMVVGWLPLLSKNPHLDRIMVPGMQGHGLLLMMVIYITARLLFMHHIPSQYPRSLVWFALFIIGIVLNGVMGIRIPDAVCYASPLVIATSVSGFLAFKTMRPLPMGFSRLINFISPSMYGVYVLHLCCIDRFQYFGGGVDLENIWGRVGIENSIAHAMMRAVFLFFMCVLIDLLRRGLMYVGTCLTKYLRHCGN